MLAPRRMLPALWLFAVQPAAAQLSTRAIALETGISAPALGRGGAFGMLALSASTWLDGEVEAVARLSFGSGQETDGRGAASLLSGTLGLRLTLAPDPLRPQIQADVGWMRADARGQPEDRLAIGVSAGLEWFPERNLSLAARVALRGPPADLRAEASLAAAAYF